MISAVKKGNQGNRTGLEEVSFELMVRESVSEKRTGEPRSDTSSSP